MKTIPIALAAHYAQRWHTVCLCLKVTLTDSTVLAWTSLSRALPVSGISYLPGLALSSLSSSDVLNTDNLDMTMLPGDDIVLADLVAGRWRGAAFEIFEVNYASPADGINPLKNGTIGELQLRSTGYVLEFLSLKQSLQATQGIVTNKTCRARLGDAKCTLDLTAFTYTGALTAVDGTEPQRLFTASGRGEAGGWFAEGLITFTSGANLGFTQKVKAFVFGGQFELSLPLPYPVAIGDTYSVVAGCRKRLEEDCIAKFSNALNFQGEPHLPGIDALSKPAAAATQTPDVVPIIPGDTEPAGDGGA